MGSPLRLSALLSERSEGMEQFLDEVNFMEWNLHQDKGRPSREGVALLAREFYITQTLFRPITTIDRFTGRVPRVLWRS